MLALRSKRGMVDTCPDQAETRKRLGTVVRAASVRDPETHLAVRASGPTCRTRGTETDEVTVAITNTITRV